MEKSSGNNVKTLKIIFIIIAIIIVLFTLTGNILTSKEGGAVSLTAFESFYAFIILIGISLYLVINNKSSNVLIFLSILTYGWTYYLVQEMIDYIKDVTIVIEPLFYVYLSSAILLIISLFINEKKQINNESSENIQNLDNDIKNNLNKDNFIFGSFVLGLKGVPLNTDVLLVNNITDKSLDLIYAIEGNNQKIQLSINDIKNISYKSSVRIQNGSKKVESYETKSMLLSAAVFGGNPMLQLAGNSAFNSLFDEISNNYDRVNINEYFEITIETVINEEETRFIVSTDTNPDKFIKQVNNK